MSLWRYAGPVRALVHAFKFRGRSEVLAPLGRRMAGAPRAAALATDADLLVVPVPATRAGRRARGYDQATGLARGVAAALGRPCEPLALRRRRTAASQAASLPARRRVQLRGALAARPALVQGRAALVVDDVLSTGATADAAARALRTAGALDVTVLTLAT